MLLDKEIFYSHLSKHKHIEIHLLTFVYVPTRFIRILEQEGFKENSTFCTFLANFIKKVDDDFSEPGDLKAEIRDWNKSANKKKNDGLYVGLNRDNGIWHDPRSLTQRDYEADRRFSAKMIELALKFDELHIKWKALR